MTTHAATPRAASRPTPATTAALIAGILAAAAVAWVVLARRMAGMDMGPGGDPGTLGWFTITWAVMTVAMMLPASAAAARSLAPAAAPPFLAAYVALWTAAGLAGYAVIEGIRALHVGALAWPQAGRYLAAAALIAAAVYQFTSAKRRWLTRCTSPHLPPAGSGFGAALRAGARHGGCCIACCATLMAALYALGIMSIPWMVVITVLIAAERLLPRPALTVRAVAAVLIALGIAVAAVPGAVPQLTIPARTGRPGAAGPGTAGHAMPAMAMPMRARRSATQP